MSQEYECPWCKKIVQKVQYPIVHEFLLWFETGTTSDIFGPNTTGYEIENMCADCAMKLKKELGKLGIELITYNV